MKVVCISASQVPSITANSIQVMKACQALAEVGHAVHLLVPGGREHFPSLPQGVTEEHAVHPLTPAPLPGVRRRTRGEGYKRLPSPFGGGVGVREADLIWESLAAHYGLRTPFEVSWLQANPRWKRYDFALAAVRQARRLGADMLYAWPLQAALIGSLYGFPVLVEIHGPAEGKLGPLLLRGFMRLPGKDKIRRLLPITRALAAMLETQTGRKFQPGECVIAPNGVDLARYQDIPEPAEARRMLGLPGNESSSGLTVGYTGHLYAGRGMGMLEYLAQRLPHLHFLWVGGHPEDVHAWRQRLEDQGIRNVSLVGFVENQQLPLYQAAADILLMPYERSITGSSGGNSAAYASPMKMFEYMACRRAILSSDLPVIREVLNETNAVLVPPEDEQAWEQALQALASEAYRRQALADRAWQDVQGYSWEQRARNALAGLGDR